MVNRTVLISHTGSTYNSLKRKLIDFLPSVRSEEFPVFPAHLSKEVERQLERGWWGLTVTYLFTHQSVRNPHMFANVLAGLRELKGAHSGSGNYIREKETQGTNTLNPIGFYTG